ncbi:sigma-70 family RNA polymerase sigma factor [Arenibaculum pallidiluteum]|uniref:sigma-70 family RNA polymerase sigma factor n=1 Tax=Arenibaculum pallidiluteum TaxID=2812559 RepID=UPI001A97B2AD|nr:sigma-70 family RNA polymerase sigma factor [Arenibaculum pallidiluteum]
MKRALSDFERELLSHQDDLLRFARRLTGRRGGAEDLRQDTLVLALASRESFMPGTVMRAWLFTIMRNIWVNQARRDRVDAVEDGVLHTLMPQQLPNQERRLELRDVNRALKALPAGMHEAIGLCAFHGLPYKVAARAAKPPTSEGTIKSRLSRGRDALRLALEPA